jgi:subtilisin family serine protease
MKERDLESRKESEVVRRETYIVVLSGSRRSTGDRRSLEEVRAIANETAQRLAGTLTHIWAVAIEGFAIEIPVTKARELASDPRFETVEKDGAVRLASDWGDWRIARRTPCGPVGNLPPDGGAGVDLFVIDSGVARLRSVFGDRLLAGYPDNSDDVEGHGTLVAALAAGNEFGLADKARVIPVRVKGEFVDLTKPPVISGVEWVTAEALKTPQQPSVALMAMSTAQSPALDLAVCNSIDAGVTYVVAAGNENTDAGTISPADVERAITVGAIVQGNCDCEARWVQRNQGSNFGTVVDLFAPGDGSDTNDRKGEPATIDATSAASAIVAGVALRYISRFKPGSYPSPKEVEAALVKLASKNGISGLGKECKVKPIVYALFDQPLIVRLLSALRTKWHHLFRRSESSANLRPSSTR